MWSGLGLLLAVVFICEQPALRWQSNPAAQPRQLRRAGRVLQGWLQQSSSKTSRLA